MSTVHLEMPQRRFRLAAGLAVACAILQPPMAAAAPDPAARTRHVDPPVALDDFALINQHGDRTRLSDLHGSTTLVFFGFTNCRSVCPPMMQKLKQVDRALADDRGGLTTILVSVDGDRDSPPVMKAFLEPFGAGFAGLTGDPLTVREIAARFSAVFFKGMPHNQAGDYDVEHTSQVYLIDAAGRLRATFYDATVDDMTAATRAVMQERPPASSD